MNNVNRTYSVDDAIRIFLEQLAGLTGWKYLKSRKCLKKKVGDLVFELLIHTSKWNLSHERVEMQCECRMWCKKFDKKSNVKSTVGYYKIDISDTDWLDITTDINLTNIVKAVFENVNDSVLPLCKQFELDFTEATKMLVAKENFDKYNVRIEFIDVYAGREYVEGIAQEYYESLSEIFKQDVLRYKNGARDKPWMINPSNLKYIVDNDIVSI